MRRATRMMRWLATATCVACMCGVSLGQEGAPALPPEMERMLDAGPKGSLMVRATPGTKDGSSAAGAAIHVELFHSGQPIRHINAVLDENAMVVLGDIPVAMAVRPLVKIEFAGVTYQEFAKEMSAAQANVAIDITVYDVTETEPSWRVAMRQVTTSPGLQSVLVSETVVVENMSDRTWLGGEPDERENRTTVRMSLPKGADRVNLDSGFHGWCCTVFKDGVLGVQMPLMPERVTFRYSYEVPVTGDGAVLEFGSAAPTSALSVLVPENAASVSPVGLAAAGMAGSEHGTMRVFEGKLEAGASGGVVLAALVTSQGNVIPMAEKTSGGNWTKIGAGMGLALVVVLVIVVIAVMRRQG